MYLAEVKYFLTCIENNISPSPGIQDSKYIFENLLSLG